MRGVDNEKEMVGYDLHNCCLSAFGSGLTWGAVLMKLGKMDFCKTIKTKL